MNVNRYASLERRLHMLEKLAGVGQGVLHVVVRDSPDVTKDEALARYIAGSGKTPGAADTVLYVDIVSCPEDVARYDTEGK